ncbi:MAG: RNA polymerase subunit sigma-54 [Bacteroidales bacterium]
MDIRIQAIHFDATEKLEAFVRRKVAKLEKYYDGILLAEVILKVVKPETAQNKHASVKLKIRSGELYADKTGDTFERAIDECAEALSKQLLKFKEKKRAK